MADPVGAYEVYRVYDRSGALLYVGCTTNIFRRMVEHHASRQPWLGEAERVSLQVFVSRRKAHDVELTAIRNEAPRHNQIGRRSSRADDLARSIAARRMLGETLQSIGAALGISRQRVHQILIRRAERE